MKAVGKNHQHPRKLSNRTFWLKLTARPVRTHWRCPKCKIFMWSMINLATNYASIKMPHHIQLQNKPDSSALISSPHTPPAPHKAQQEGLTSPFMEDRPLLTSPPPRSQSSTPRRTHSTNTQAHDEWHLAFYLSQGHSTHQIQSLPSVSLSLFNPVFWPAAPQPPQMCDMRES